MKRMQLINHLLRRGGGEDYLEIGVCKGHCLSRILAKHRTGVDPYPDMDAVLALEDQLDGAVLNVQTSDEFFQQNRQKFDVILVDGLHLYEQAVKDLLNALNRLKPGGLVVMHDLRPKTASAAGRTKPQGDWNGDVWKVAVDIRRHYPGIGFFVVDTDHGLGVYWKKDPQERFQPAWKQDILDLDYGYFQAHWQEFQDLVPPDFEAIDALLDQALPPLRQPASEDELQEAALAETPPNPSEARQPRRATRNLDEFLAACRADGPDLVYTGRGSGMADLDPNRFRSNVSPDFFRAGVLRNTRGMVYAPPLRAYLLHEARLSPLIGNRPGPWSHEAFVRDQDGRLVPELMQRRNLDLPPVPAGADPVRRSGRFLYLGQLLPSFGHFLSEALSRFWLLKHLEGLDAPCLFHVTGTGRKRWDGEPGRALKRMAALCGLDPERVEFVDRDTVLETLIAPVGVNDYFRGVGPELLHMADELKGGLGPLPGGGPERVFLSRSKLSGRRLANAKAVEAVFAGHGFAIVHPQELGLAEQAGLMHGAEMVAGEEGSAMANLLFARNPVVFELETGRCHPNLPQIAYHKAREYNYLWPFTVQPRRLPVSLEGRTFAHPLVLDHALAKALGRDPLGEAVLGPKQYWDACEAAWLASLSGDVSLVSAALKVMACFEKPDLKLDATADLAEALAANLGMTDSKTGAARLTDSGPANPDQQPAPDARPNTGGNTVGMTACG